MNPSIGIAILAAGKGTRLNLDHPKPLTPICGRRLIDFPLTESLAFAQKTKLQASPVVVTGHRRGEVEEYLNKKYAGLPIGLALQREQRGTADALKAYFDAQKRAQEMDLTLVLCADTPLIRRGDLSFLYQTLQEEAHLQAIAAVFHTDHPHGHGRIIMPPPPFPGFHIVEEKEANDEIRKITTVNSGLCLLRTPFLLQQLQQIRPSKSNEFYLTDIFQDELPVKALLCPNSTAFLGVNTLIQLSDADFHIRREINRRHQEHGVHIIDPRHTYIDWDVTIGAGSVIHPHNFIYSGTKIGPFVTIGPSNSIKETEIREYAHIKSYSYLEGAIIGEHSSIGPFARIRPGSDIGESAKIGNFVETKQVKIERAVKVGHLSYVGDAEIGEETNIGCGFITCNYDGANKHRTTIGKRSFIGSDTQTIAPISIGDDAYIGSGSTISKDVPEQAFAVARARQVTREGMAKRFKK